MSISIWRFGVLCGAVGAVMASILAACWYTPFVLDSPQYGNVLTNVSTVLWPTARMVGGWVGSDEPVRYWLRVGMSVLANAGVYASVGAISIVLMRRFRAH